MTHVAIYYCVVLDDAQNEEEGRQTTQGNDRFKDELLEESVDFSMYYLLLAICGR